MEVCTGVRCFVCGEEDWRITLIGPSGRSIAGDAIVIECIGCRDRWELGVCAGPSEVGECGEDAEGDPAVGEAGDVAADVVSAAKGKGGALTSAERSRRYRTRKRLRGQKVEWE